MTPRKDIVALEINSISLAADFQPNPSYFDLSLILDDLALRQGKEHVRIGYEIEFGIAV